MSMKSKAKKPKVNKVDVKEEEVVAAPAPAEDRLLQEDSDDDDLSEMLVLLYNPGGTAQSLRRHIGRTVEFRIPARHLSLTNPAVVARQLWGSDVYSDDSDVVAILAHTGLFPVRQSAPTKLQGVSVFARVSETLDAFSSTTRYGIMSKAWPTQHSRASIQIVRVEGIERADLLDPRVKKLRTMPAEIDRYPQRTATQQPKRKLNALSVLVHNSTNDVWLKYHPLLLQDRGAAPEMWTATRLIKESIQFETPFPVQRFELSREVPDASASGFDTYRLTRLASRACDAATAAEEDRHDAKGRDKEPARKRKGKDTPTAASAASASTMFANVNQVLEAKLDWDEVQWGMDSVTVRQQVLPIFSVAFVPL